MKTERLLPILFCLCLQMILAGFLAPAKISAENVKLSAGQTVYVPVYSHIYSGVKGRPFDLTATLSLRNTNLNNPITLVSERYIIPEGDRTGGSGANFIVVWQAEGPVNPPIIEAVMIGTHSG